MTVELVKSSFLIFVEIKEGWLVGIGLKRRWNRKEGRGNKDFKKGGGASWVKGWVPQKRGDWNPFTNYDICYAPFSLITRKSCHDLTFRVFTNQMD